MQTIGRFGDDAERIMFVFEDCGKLLSMESSMESPQIESLLLNISDGLIGSGREDIFLFTFNFEIGKIPDAIRRPGRMLGEIEFEALSGGEINRFFCSVGQEDRLYPSTPMTLAQLYAEAFGRQDVSVQEKRKVGF
jgi:hypothetical protein